MKKIFILILSFIFVIMLVSCSEEAIPEGEYLLSVEAESHALYEPLKRSYKAGETVIVKTDLVTDTDEYVELNGAKSISSSVVQDENGKYIYKQYIFTMPAMNSLLEIKYKEGMGIGYNVTLNDPEGYIINRVGGMKMAGETYEIHAKRSDIIVNINGEPIAKNPEAVKNSDGEILYYKWSYKMPKEDITISLSRWEVLPSELPMQKLTFINETGIDGLFSNSISGEYSHGEPIHITVNPNYLVDDKGIILKVNGKLLEETDIYEWLFVMPDEDVTVTAYLTNTSWGEEWHYLDIDDRYGLLSRVYDGYYKAGQTITIVTKTFYEEILIDLWSEMGLEYERQEYAKEDAYEYTFVLTMPSEDVTISVLEVDTFDD